MESMRPVRFALVIASVLVVSAIAGGLFGRGTASSQERLPDRYRAFTTALRLIETDYVEKTESDRLVYSAISGMLQTLDPHSSFLDPRTYGQMRERQQGRYYGLGITIQVIDGDITAVSLFEGSPAYRKGVRRGDVIAQDRRRGRQGLDQRAGGAAAAGAQGHDGPGVAPAPGLRPVDRTRRAARRDQHPDHRGGGHDRRDDGVHPAAGFRRADRQRPVRGAQGPVGQGHAPAAARLARQSGRAARPGDPRRERVPPAGADDRVYARPGPQLRPGLPRDGEREVHRPAPRGARQPEQRERVRDRERRAAGSRPRGHRRRNDVRQGAGPVGLPDQRGRRPRADDGALLHAERAADPAALGRHLRRVPDLHVPAPRTPRPSGRRRI